MRAEEVEYLRRRSREFLETAKIQFQKGFYGLASFSLEQALQLIVKAKLLECGGDYPRTHSVRSLLSLLGRLLGGEAEAGIKKIMGMYSLELALLEDAYIVSRYVPREFSADEVERLMKAVEEVSRFVEGLVC